MTSRRRSFERRLVSGPPVLLDSAMGTELERRGFALPAPIWSTRALLEAPDLVAGIHRDNVAGGAEILTAATFRTNPRALAAAGLSSRAAELSALALSLARREADRSPRPAWVAGSIAPAEDCYRPDLVPGEADLEAEHQAHARNLAAAGADLLLVETVNCVRELRAATAAATATGLPVVACVVTDGAGRLLSGEPLEEAARSVLALGPAAIGVNCVPSRQIGAEIDRLREMTPVTPLVAYANVLSEPDSPGEYAERALGWTASGARLVGGCCGTTPAHTRALALALAG
jgi:S-methylmethionine-dependent homocysteine/selenocysteine methylase